MPDKVTDTNINEVTKSSDGNVQISVEKYDELLERAADKAPIINRTTVVKTPEMVAKELRTWGFSFMGVGASLFTVGVFLYRSGRS